MARVWLPPQSDSWLALREPALLLPNRLPIGNVVLRADGLARGLTACLVAEGGSLRDIVANVSPSVDAASGERVILGKVGPAYSGGSGVNTRFANEARFAPIGGSGFTVVAWFDVDALTNYSAIAAFQQTTTTDGWELRLGGAGGVTGSDINFAQCNGVGVRAWRSGANRYSAGQRQAFLACSRDGQQIQTAPLIHWGTGSVVASASVGGAVGDMTVPASRELYVGHRYDNVTRLDGAVGMLLIYDRALSVAELDALYARGPAALFEPAANEPIFIGAAGGGGGAAALDGAATATADATGALTTQIPIVGAAASVATAAGSITTSIPLAGASAAVAAAAGDLSASIRLDGAALAQALATAGLTTAIPLAGGAGGEAAGTGDLTTSGGSAALSGLAQAVATGQADLTIQIRLAGAAVAQAVAAADLTAPGQGMAGSAQAAAAATGALTTAIPIIGGAASVTSADGSLTTIIPLAGAAASVSSAQGSLDLALPLVGAAVAQAVAGGTLTAQIRLSGDAVAAAAASGRLDAAGSMMGRVHLSRGTTAVGSAIRALSASGASRQLGT